MAESNLGNILTNGISRRKFIGGAAAAFAAFTIVPSHVLAGAGNVAPSSKLNLACVGFGGMGGNNIRAATGIFKLEDIEAGGQPLENVVALCDVDTRRGLDTIALFPQAKVYQNYIKMLDECPEIDAVIVASPDHTHAVIAMEAMKRGKHVYVQKPMTRTVWEARMLTEAARKYGVVTQMGNQGNSSEEIRLICEWIWAGAIGNVTEVHTWTNRPVWPQGMMAKPTDGTPVPKELDWDLWIGSGKWTPYVEGVYHPFNWHGWCDYGTGALGDMACHILDPVVKSLKLKYPVAVEGTCSTRATGWEKTYSKESFPDASMIRYYFPAREGMPEVKVVWYDGGLMPERPVELEPGRRMGDGDGGVIFVGDKGKLMCGCYARNPRLIPETAMREFKRPEKTLPRIEGGMDGHERSWIKSIKEGVQPSSNFDYSGPFTEMVVMGNLATRFPNTRLDWDGENMKVTNVEEANAFVKEPYREGWSL